MKKNESDYRLPDKLVDKMNPKHRGTLKKFTWELTNDEILQRLARWERSRWIPRNG